MKIIQHFVTANACYQGQQYITPKGIMLHSIGCPQESAKLMANSYNQYKPGGDFVCVHAFLDPNEVHQTLPWNMKSWHCGGGANSTHIGIEMCEPNTIKYTGGASWKELSDGKHTKEYVMGTYNQAVELFAALCVEYKLDPLKDGVIISHSEGCKRGVASNHGDVEHIWNRFGLTMDEFRKAIKAKMEGNDVALIKDITAVPKGLQSEVRTLLDCGAINGGTDMKTNPNDINMEYDDLRAVIMSKRYTEFYVKSNVEQIVKELKKEISEEIRKGLEKVPEQHQAPIEIDTDKLVDEIKNKLKFTVTVE